MVSDVLWRDTGLTPKILILDARAVFPLALWLFHWAWWTAALAFGHARPFSGAAHRHDARSLFPSHPCGLYGTPTRNETQ